MNNLQYILQQHTPTQSLDVPWYVSNGVKNSSSSPKKPTITYMFSWTCPINHPTRKRWS